MLLMVSMLMTLTTAMAQDNNTPLREGQGEAPTFVPMVKVGKALDNGDSIKYVEMNNVYVYAPLQFKNEKQRRTYDRTVYNVKKVLPIAKEVNRAIIETYEYLETLPDDKARREHMKFVEKSIKAEYTPKMKKLTLTQGKLLIKLVYRETNSSTYDLVKVFFGTGRAMFYQSFAWMFGASLKKVYDPEGKDKLTERVVRMVEAGQL
ncbi:MAG: DUF4294 domain-containing protein [Prevotella sp.]|nr:DUF4294 domain-containing protein [Prevotella sp.]